MNASDPLELAYGLYRYENPAPKRVDFVHVRDLTKQEFDSAASAIFVIDEILRGFDVFLDAAVRELQDTIDTLKSDLRETNRARDHTSWAPILEYRALCVSVAVRMYEEHVFSHVHREWGKISLQHDEVSALFHALYDKSLDYRVYYYLRNALVHSSRRLVKIDTQARIVGPRKDERTEVAIGLRLSRSAFGGSDVKPVVRSEVEALLVDPDLVERSRQVRLDVKRLNEALMPWLHPGRDLAVRTIWSFMLETLRDGQGGPHFHKHPSSTPMTGMSQLNMTTAIFNYVRAAGPALGLRHGTEK